MDTNRFRSGTSFTGQQLQAIALVAEGRRTNKQIAADIGVHEYTVIRWRNKPKFKKAVEDAQKEILRNIDPSTIGRRPEKLTVIVDQKVKKRALRDFEFFRREFLDRKPVKCQKRWAEWIMAEDRTVILCPREHGKTYTVRDYAAWRIILDRNIRILVISMNEKNARRWIKSIKAILGRRRKLIDYFGIFKPPGKPEKWTESEIIVEGADPELEDPTLRSLGMTAAMDGLRADLIIVDDPVNVLSSSSEDQREKTEEVIFGSVDHILDNTLGRNPKMVVIGTRKHVLDIYNKLTYTLGFNVHTEKAVLSWEHNGKILCPELYNNAKIDGVYYKDGISFFRHERDKGLRRFNREYQNAAFDDQDVIVPSDAFDDGANLDEYRSYGDTLPNWYIVVNVDPGTSLKLKGTFCMTVEGVDPDQPEKRYLIDYFDELIPSEDQPGFLCSIYHDFGAGAMAIESNACQKYLMDAVSREAKAGGMYKGLAWPPMIVNVHPHFTSQLKYNDPIAGLEVVGTRFERGQFSLPYVTDKDKAKTDAFIEKICAYTYREHKKAHALMTLYFGENDIMSRLARNLESYYPAEHLIPPFLRAEHEWVDLEEIANE